VCEVMDLPEEIELRRDRDVLEPGVAIAKLKTLIVVKLFVTGCHGQGVMYQVIPPSTGTRCGYQRLKIHARGSSCEYRSWRKAFVYCFLWELLRTMN